MAEGKPKSQSGVWSTVKPFVNGGASGMLATCVIQPIDMVKVNHRSLPSLPNSLIRCAPSVIRLRPLFDGISYGFQVRIQLGQGSAVQVTKNMLANEGFGSFYKGLSAGLLRQATYTTARLGSFRRLLLVLQLEQLEQVLAVQLI
ncbi:hypothetical protein BHE74_00004618 [Ensete ventricosum]|nr:hypothetical protein BHE74_00004618 [Ensete ventricosum]